MEKSGIDTGSATGNRATNQAKWTFMVYMAGDNNLDGATLRDIEEMARAGSTKEVNILVQLDRIEDNLTRRFRIYPLSDVESLRECDPHPSSKVVTPVKTGVQCFCNTLKSLDSGFHRNDDSLAFLTFDEFVKDDRHHSEVLDRLI
jgi:hypothetical protein